VLDKMFDEDVVRVTASRIGEAAQFSAVLPLACRLDEEVDHVAVAGVGEPAQLVEIIGHCPTPLRSSRACVWRAGRRHAEPAGSEQPFRRGACCGPTTWST
jgi:hypothetical protein